MSWATRNYDPLAELVADAQLILMQMGGDGPGRPCGRYLVDPICAAASRGTPSHVPADSGASYIGLEWHYFGCRVEVVWHGLLVGEGGEHYLGQLACDVQLRYVAGSAACWAYDTGIAQAALRVLDAK